MGLKISTLVIMSRNIIRGYYLYALGYHNWDEPIDNFDMIAKFVADNISIVIQGIKDNYFYSSSLTYNG